MKYFWILLSIFVIAVSSSCSSSEASATNERIEEAQREGKWYADNLPLVENKQVVKYVEGVAKKLLATQPAQAQKVKVPLRYYVMNIPDKSGFSSFTSGGYIFLERSEIENTKTEGEIAGVLAHEIAHNHLGHIVSATGYEWCMEYLQRCEDGFHRVGREEELAADALAVRMMAAAGYDPEDLAQNFLRVAAYMQKIGATSYPTHPSLYDRVKKIRLLAMQIKVSKKPIKSTDGLKQSKKLLKNIKPRALPLVFYL